MAATVPFHIQESTHMMACRSAFLVATTIAAFVWLPPANPTVVRAQAGATAFVGATIIDGSDRAPIQNGVLIVRDGKVAQIGTSATIKPPAGARTIDVKGKTLIPGLVNAHGHVADVKGLQTGPQFYTDENVRAQLRQYGRYGVTTVFSLGGDGAIAFTLRDAQNSAALDRPRIFVAGDVIVGDTPADARQMTEKVAALKPDFIKIRVDDNLGTAKKMTPDIYKAVIDAAHARKLPVASHLYYLDDAKGLLQAGTDLVAHSIRDKPVDAELISLLKQRDTCVVPTLLREVSTFVYETEPAFFKDPYFTKYADAEVLGQLREPARQRAMRESKSAQTYKKALEIAKRNLKALSDAGVRIAMGTDTGPAARFQGYFEQLELEMMVEAGLTPKQVIKSATSDAARCMRMAGRIGTLEPGAWADLIVLTANPLENIRNTRTIESVWVAGNQMN
jgi:imidazolonepropionase-like amidohydrolase